MTDDTLHSRSAIVNKIETIPTAARHSSISKKDLSAGERERLCEALRIAAEEFSAASTRLTAAKNDLDAFDCTQAGIAIGNIVFRNGLRFRVSKMEVWRHREDMQPMVALYGNPQLKDGPFGSRQKYIGLEADWRSFIVPATGA